MPLSIWILDSKVKRGRIEIGDRGRKRGRKTEKEEQQWRRKGERNVEE
jgi:hypothetical protein